MTHLANALEWKYGAVADTAGESITAWRHKSLPKPTDEAIAAAVVEYEQSLVATKDDRDLGSELLAVKDAWLIDKMLSDADNPIVRPVLERFGRVDVTPSGIKD